jgi:hypothetical protein
MERKSRLHPVKQRTLRALLMNLIAVIPEENAELLIDRAMDVEDWVADQIEIATMIPVPEAIIRARRKD